MLACQQQDEVIVPQDQQPEPINNELLQQGDGLIQLGEKLQIPYTVENMQKAWDNINSNARVTEDVDIQTTHLYIKFIPKNEQELEILKDDSTLILYDYPLDYEIAEGGVYYRDPSIPEGQPTPQYCAVKVNKILPQRVEYELLAELFIPDDYSDEENARLASDDLIDALVDEALRITDNLDDENVSNGRVTRSKWTPRGNILLFDDALNRTTGVTRIFVRARRWFTTHIGLTSSNGYFSCNGRFRRPANYSFRWEKNYDIRSGTIGQAMYNGPKIRGDWNLTISSGKSRMYAIVYQAAYNYYYGNRLGLKTPPINTRLKISVYDKSNSDANGKHCKNCRFLGIFSRLYVWNDGGTLREIYATAIHELAHASHWELRKNRWKNVTSGKLKESWAIGVSWSLTRIRYPNYIGRERRNPPGDYTLIVADMIDDTSTDNTNNGFGSIPGEIQDNVSGYTIKQIEDVLSTTSTWNDWENNIRNRYNNGTEDNLGDLFQAWE